MGMMLASSQHKDFTDTTHRILNSNNKLSYASTVPAAHTVHTYIDEHHERTSFLYKCKSRLASKANDYAQLRQSLTGNQRLALETKPIFYD